MQLDNHQQLFDTFVEFYIDQEHILLKNDLRKYFIRRHLLKDLQTIF